MASYLGEPVPDIPEEALVVWVADRLDTDSFLLTKLHTALGWSTACWVWNVAIQGREDKEDEPIDEDSWDYA